MVLQKLDDLTQVVAALGVAVVDQGKILADHTRILTEHSTILSDHGKILTNQSTILANHSTILSDLGKAVAAQGVTALQEHNFVSDRVVYLKNRTSEFTHEACNSTATKFGMEYEGFVADVTVSHSKCSSAILLDWVPCEGIDIALSKACPERSSVFPGRYGAELREADRIVLYGFGPIRASVGIVGGAYEKTTFVQPPFTGILTSKAGDFVAIGDQFAGQSGALILNTQGAVGVAHGYRAGAQRLVLIVPLDDIQKCFRVAGAAGSIKRRVDCTSLVDFAPPPTMLL